MRLIFKKTILLTAFICIVIGQAHATKRYWIASTTANWSSTANWSATSGGASGASVPSSLTVDTAFFDGNGLGNCNINTNITVGRLEVKSTYTDTIFQNAYTLTVWYYHMILNGGTFKGSTSNILVYGHYNNNACNFISTSGTLEVRGDFKLTGTGSFIHNNGTMKFGFDGNFGTTTTTISTSSSNKTFNNLIFDCTGSGRSNNITSGNTLTVNGTFTISGNGEYRINTGTIEAKGNIVNTNTSTFSNTGTGTILIDGSGTQHFSNNSTLHTSYLPKITITKSSSDSLLFSGYLNMLNDFTYNSGILIFGNSKLILCGSLIMTGSMATEELWIYPYAGHTTITVASGTTITVNDTLRYDGSSSWLIVVNTGTIAAKGDIVLASANTNTSTGTGTILINGSGNQTLTGSSALQKCFIPAVTINKTGGTLYLQNYINTYGNWTYTAGTINAGTSTVFLFGSTTISGSHTLNNLTFGSTSNFTYTIASGTTVTTTGTLSIVGVSAVNINTGTLEAKGDIVLTNTYSGMSGNATILINGTVNQTITGNTTIYKGFLPNVTINKSSGTLYLQNYINIIGNWTYTAGTVNAGTSTVSFWVGNTISGSHTLNNVTFIGNGNYTFTIASGTTLTTTGTLSIAGGWANIINTGTLEAKGDISVSNTYGAPFASTGNILIDGNANQTLTGPGTISKGTLPKITINKTGGTLHLSSIINMWGDWEYIAGTVDPGTSTLVICGAGTGFIGSTTLYNVTFPGNAGYAQAMSSGTIITTTGTLNFLGSAAITVNTGTFNVHGDIYISNAATTSGTGTASFVINGTGRQTITGSGVLGTGHLPKITINKPSDTLHLASIISANNDWTYTAGIIDGGTSTVGFYGAHTITGSHTLKNITFPGNAATTHTIASGTTLTAAGTLRLQGSSAITFNTGTLNAKGDLTAVNTSTVTTSGTATILINGTANQKFTGQGSAGKGYLPKISINKTSGTLSMDSTLSLINDWSYTAGTIDASTYSNKVYFYGTHNASCQGTSTTMCFYDVFFAGITSLNGNLKTAHDLTINTGNTLTQGNYDVNIGRNWTHNGTWTVGTGTNTFDGTYLGTITRASSAIETFPKLVINKSSNRVEYNVPIIVSTSLALTKGAVKTTNSSLFTINSGVTVTGGSDSSYIEAQIKKIGNAAFSFPLGSTTYTNANYHPVSITAPSSSTDAYTAQYYATGQTLGNTIHTAGIENIGICDYWGLARTTGSSNVTPSIEWSATTCNLQTDLYQEMAYWDTTNHYWVGLGIGSGSGYNSSTLRTNCTSSTTLSFSGTTATYMVPAGKTSLIVKGIVVHKTDSATSDGSITLTVTGGSTPYTYLWGGSQTTSAITGLSAGMYSVTVTDYLGSQVKKYFFVGSKGVSATYTITPDAIAGKDASIILGDDGITDLNNNYGTTGSYESSHTTSGVAQKTRSLLSFDLSSFPIDAQISSATLNLYGVGGNVNGTGAQPTNQAYLMRVGQSWNENRVNWSNQPNTFSSDQVTLSATSNSTQDYSLDVTSHVKKFVANPYANNGWMLQLANETATNALSIKLGSSDNSNSAIRPSLVITIGILSDCDRYRNWVKQTTFGEEGEIISQSKSFTDNLGRETQSQVRILTDNSVLATQSLYDGYGRLVGQTLPAPTNQATLCYKTSFVTLSSGADYSYNDFDMPITGNNYSKEVNNPDPLGNTAAGTVGWYYSNNNSTEGFVATSSHPYSRVEYFDDPLNRTKRSSSVDDAHVMGSGHESKGYTMASGGELALLYGSNGSYTLNEDFTVQDLKNENLRVYKSVGIDADGKEVISYSNSVGQTIATCASGLTNDPHSQLIAQPVRFENNGFTDIHLPASKNATLKFPKTALKYNLNSTLTGGLYYVLLHDIYYYAIPNSTYSSYTSIEYVITDIEKGKVLTAGTSVGNGDYYLDPITRMVSFSSAYTGRSLYLRIAYRVRQENHNGSTVTVTYSNSGYNAGAPEFAMEYELDYSNWSLTYYDNKGRFLSSVAPNDVDFSYSPTTDVITTNKTGTGITFNISSAPTGITSRDGSLYINGIITQNSTLTLNGRMMQSGGTVTTGSLARASSSIPLDTTVIQIDSAAMQRSIITPELVSEALTTKNAGVDYTPSLYLVDSTGTVIDTLADSTIATNRSAGKHIILRANYSIKYTFSNGNTPIDNNNGAYYQLYFDWERTVDNTDPSLGIFYRTEQLLQSLPEKFIPPSVMAVLTKIEVLRTSTEFKLENYGTIYDGTFYTVGDPNSGVNLTGNTSLDLNDAANAMNISATLVERDYHNVPINNNQLTTKNYYDKRNRIVASQSPDEGRRDVIYDDEDKIRFSQNDKQRTASIGGRFSYVNYDVLNRTVESGEYDPTIVNIGTTRMFFQTQAQYDASQNAAPSGSTSVISILENVDGLDDPRCTQQTYIAYDEPDANIPSISGASPAYTQSYVNGHISKTWNANSTTWYSYNEQGLNTWNIQSVNGLGNKTTNYTYGLFGDLLQTAYQKETSTESFYHKYEYDADKRLLNAYTSLDNSTWTLQNKNYYYAHGSLKRQELGGTLQGIDYVYTITGALKSVNDPYLTSSDPGSDSYSGAHSNFSKDVFAYSLDYYTNDYVRSGTGIQNYNSSSFSGANNLYSGTIKSVRWQTQLPTAATNNFTGTLMYEYNYDERQQLKDAVFGQVVHNSGGSTPSNSSSPVFSNVLSYKTTNLNYDLNGNITNLKRYGYIATGDDPYPKDDLTYYYSSTIKNRLLQVSDAIGTPSGNEYDFPHQGNTANYTYDEIGQLIGDEKENSKTCYDASGLVTSINVKSTNIPKVSFLYNEKGLRQKKTVYDVSGNATDHYWYVYDATGTLQSTYHTDVSSSTTTQQELYMFAGGRLGTYNRTASRYFFELSDHLGNIRAVVAKSTSSSAVEVQSFSDYYPHGGVMPSRNYVTTPTYKLGYQGQEKDAETGFTNFELRQLDPRLGRWFAPDPNGQYHSPYLAMGNNPVSSIDPDGGVDWQIDGVSVSEHTYNNYTGFSGASFEISYGGLAVGTVLGYSYNGANYYGSFAYKNALGAQKDAINSFMNSHGGSSYDGEYWLPYNHSLASNYGNAQGESGQLDISDIINGGIAKNVTESATMWTRFAGGAGNQVLSDIAYVSKLGQGDGEAWKKLGNTVYVMAALATGDSKTSTQLSLGLITTVQNIPNWRAEDYGAAAANIGEGVLISKGIGAIGNIAKAEVGITILGDDAATLSNASKLVEEEGVHQVLVHGTPEGFVVNGTSISPKDLARTMLEGGHKQGTPIRLISCQTGVFGDGAAYQLSRYLKSPVLAPTNLVSVGENGIFNILQPGRWKLFP